jgi:hypothetical protein
MIETDSKQTQKAKWLETHTLSPEQLKQLIQNKFVRAAQYHEAVRKREELLKRR